MVLGGCRINEVRISFHLILCVSGFGSSGEGMSKWIANMAMYT